MNADGQSIELSLLVRADSEPLSGSVVEPGGEQRSFIGWSGLAAALTLALADARVGQPQLEEDQAR